MAKIPDEDYPKSPPMREGISINNKRMIKEGSRRLEDWVKLGKFFGLFFKSWREPFLLWVGFHTPLLFKGGVGFRFFFMRAWKFFVWFEFLGCGRGGFL